MKFGNYYQSKIYCSLIFFTFHRRELSTKLTLFIRLTSNSLITLDFNYAACQRLLIFLVEVLAVREYLTSALALNI